MIDILKNQLEDFKQVTLELIQNIENNQFEELDKLLKKRQSIIENINKLQYSQREFKNITTSIDILTLQKKLFDLMNLKRIELRSEMEKISEIKNANKSYHSKISSDSVYFNKKI